ncbi:MAG TPA: DUF3460 family protein [Burkholderiaceae bacterium]|jgi:hypothetical protein
MRHQVHPPPHSGYVSEFEQFMGKFLDEHPSVVKSQRDGWNIFWDHKIDSDDLMRGYRDTVPVRAYPYE